MQSINASESYSVSRHKYPSLAVTTLMKAGIKQPKIRQGLTR